MAKGKKHASELTLEEKMEAALLPVVEQSYMVPENWCWTHLGDYIEMATDYVANGSFASLKANVRILKDEDYALMVKIQDFSNNFTESLTYTDKHGYEFLEKSVLYGGELILSNIGSIGKVFRVPYFNRPMTLASNSIMIKCFNDNDYDFLYYYFLSPIGQEKLHSITTGTAVLKFNKTDLKTIALPIPPQLEQQRIVLQIKSLFSKLEEAKEKVQEVIDGFNSRRAAILAMAFSGQLTEKWRTGNNYSLDEWKDVVLSKVVLGFKYGSSKKSTYDNNGMPVLRIPNIGDGVIDFSDIKFLAHDDIDKDNQVHKDDILIIRSNGSRDLIGKCAIVPVLETDYAYASFLIRIKPSKEILPRFLVLYLNSSIARNQMFFKAKSSSGIHNINSKELGAIKIKVPYLEEQKEIVRILDEIIEKEKEARTLAEIIDDKIDAVKKSILAKAFRGKLGTNDSSDEPAVELLKRILTKVPVEEKKKLTTRKTKVKVVMKKDMLEAVREARKITPERLKEETGLGIGEFYEELKRLTEFGQVVEKKEGGDVYLEVRDAN
jgi:restriction modification system DNA specificity domain protein